MIRLTLRVFIVALCLSTLTGSLRPNQLEITKMTGHITMVTRNSPTTYYEDRNGPTGYEYELAKAFAEFLGVELRVVIADNTPDIFRTLETGKAAFAAAGLAQTPSRNRWIRFSQPYKEVTELVIYRRGGLKPNTPTDLVQGKLMVSAASSHAEHLLSLQQHIPGLSWGESADFEVSDLLQMVSSGTLDYTIVDSNEFRMLKAYFPTLDVAFESPNPHALAWAFSYSRDDSIYQAANRFFTAAQDSNLLATLSERFYGHLDTLDYVGANHFLRQTHQKLDTYRDHFTHAAHSHNFDWRLLAAVSYQESHWNPRAKSYTGVRGMMMLTRTTAKELGIKNRLDPKQSIQGGSLYLARLRERLEEVAEPDRTWLALAAYNVGFGHLQDARKLTVKAGGNPNLWMDVKEALPLLSQKRYYKHTQYGFARGQEPVDYVQNIRRYYDVLVWNDEKGTASQPPDEMMLSSSNITVIPPLL